jgi:serine/threonine protein kinase
MDTKRDILIGVLALRAGLIDADQFAAACDECEARGEVGLTDVLVERGWVSESACKDLVRLLEEKLRAHDGDPHAGFVTELNDDVRAVLTGIANTQIQTTLAGLPGRGGTHSPTPSALEETQFAGVAGSSRPAAARSALPETIDGPAAPSIFGATMTDFPRSADGGHVLLSELSSYGSGSTEERYTLTRLHAKGGIGQVWLARDAALGREVALKELRPERSESVDLRNRFLVEARVTGQLEHPGIVPIYELARRGDDSHPFYTMRFVRGGTLEEAIRVYHKSRKEGTAGSLELLTLLNAFVAVCNAVAYAHSRGIIHRDLKGQNVVLGDFGEVIVLDWGLAKSVESPPEAYGAGSTTPPVQLGETASPSATIAGQAVGTPAYMPPEQAEGRLTAIGTWSDVYSLGAMLYELLAGCPPFSGSSTTEVLRKVVKEPPVPPRAYNHEAPRSLEAVCLKAMAKTSGERYASAGELADEVRRFLADEPVKAYREPVSKQAARWARRHRPAVAAAAALVATSVLALSIGAVLVSRERDEARRQRTHARRAVDDMYTEVGEKWLEDRLDPLQKEFLERALAYYEDFSQQSSTEPALRQERGRAFMRVGDILKKLGRHEEAEKAYRRALEVLGRLVIDFPRCAEQRYHWAHAQHQLAASLAARGANADAESLYKQAMATQEALLSAPTTPTSYQADLAKTNKSLADLYRIEGKRADAEKAYERAIELGEGLLVVGPTDATIRSDLSAAEEKFGLLNRELGRNQDAEKAYRRALELEETLVAEYPTLPRQREVVFSGLSGLGLFLQDTGQIDEGEKYLRRAIAVAEGLARDFPLRPEYRRDAAKGHLNLASMLAEKKNEVAEAEEHQRRAIALYEALVSEVGDVTQYRLDLARTYNDLGTLLRSTKGKDKAEPEQLLQKAITLYEGLIAQDPTISRNRQGLALSLSNLAMHFAETNRPKDAELAYRRAIDLNEALTREFPDIAEHREKLAKRLQNYGNLLRRLNRPDEALSNYHRAAELTEALAKQIPEVPEHRLNLALILNSVAGLSEGPNKEAIYRRVIALAEGLVSEFSMVPSYREILAVGRQNLGEKLAETGKPDEAETVFRQAEAGLEQLVNEHPTMRQYPSYLAEVLKNLAKLRLGRRAPAEALPFLDRAVRLAREAYDVNPRSVVLRNNLRDIQVVYAQAFLGTLDHPSAARVAEEIAKIAPGSDRGSGHTAAARILAECIPLAEKDGHITDSQRTALAQAYADRAVTLVRSAIGAGYRELDKLAGEAVFLPLRSRDDFKALSQPVDTPIQK